MAELINIKVKVNIKGDLSNTNINFKKFKLVNAKGVKMKVIDTPEGFEEVEGEYWLELINIKKGVEYNNVHITSKQLEEPVVIGDVFIELPQPEEEEFEENNYEEATEEVVEEESFEEATEEVVEEESFEDASFDEVTEEASEEESFEEEVEEKTESSVEARLNALHVAIEVTQGYESEFEVAEGEALEARAVANAQNEKVTEFESKLAVLLKQQRESQAAYDSMINSTNDPEVSEEVKAQLLEDARKEQEKLDALNVEIERENEALNAEKENQKELNAIANEKEAIAHNLERKIISSRKVEEKIKAAILNDAAKKIQKATKESKTTVKLENQAAGIEFEAKSEKELADVAQNRYDELYKEIEALKIKAEATMDEDERAIIEAQIAKLDSMLRLAESEIKKHSSNYDKLKAKEEKILNKAHLESDKVKHYAEAAKIAMEAAKEVKGMRISDLEKQSTSENLTEKERESLTEEIKFLKLKLQGETVTIEERTNPTTEEVYNVVGAFDMSKTEKWIKNTFKKTYWIIFERGSRSRDGEIQNILLDIESKQEEVKAQIEADKAAALREIEDIKANAKAAADKLHAEAMEEQAKAKAEIEQIKEQARKEEEIAKAEAEEAKAQAQAEIVRVKEEGEKAIAAQKDEIEAKVKEAERMIEADKAKHEEIEAGLRQQVEDAKAREEEAKEETKKAIAELEAEKAASEAEAQAKIEAVEKVKNDLDKAVQEAHHRVLTVQEEAEQAKAEAERIKSTHQEHVANTKEEHEKILADAKIAVERIQNESKNNIDDLLKQIAELEAKIESLEKSKAVADKKAALLQQIEQLVEDDIKQ